MQKKIKKKKKTPSYLGFSNFQEGKRILRSESWGRGKKLQVKEIN